LVLNVNPIQVQHVKVNIEVQSTAEALDQSYGARLRIGFFKARLVQKVAARWRCMDSAVYVCPIGANLPCGEPANLSQTPSAAMQEFCAANPAAEGIPAYITGRATIFQWSCAGGVAVAGKQQFTADAQGYVAEFWHRLENP